MNAVGELPVVQRADEEFPPMPLLENWRRSDYCNGLQGNVYGHPNVPDGEYVNTSPLQWINEMARVAQTKNRLYRLGKADL